MDESDMNHTSKQMSAEVSALPSFTPGVLPGIYANELNVIDTPRETIMDFSIYYPSAYVPDEDGSITMSVSHEVVARIVLPGGTMRQFVRNYVRNHPEVLGSRPDQDEVER